MSVFHEHKPFPPMSSHFQHGKHSSSRKAKVSRKAWRGQYFSLIHKFEKLQVLKMLIDFAANKQVLTSFYTSFLLEAQGAEELC